MWRARLDTSLVRCTGAVAATRLMLEQEVPTPVAEMS